MKSYTLILILNLAFCLGHLQSQNVDSNSSVAFEQNARALSSETEVGYLFNADKGENTRGLSIRQSVLWNLDNAFSFGVGLGYDQYDSQNLLPAYGLIKANLIPNERYSPYLSAQAGLGLSITADESNDFLNETYAYGGGVYYQIGGGLTIRSRENISWLIGLAYINQTHTRERAYTEPTTNGALTVNEEYVDNRIAIRVGFVF